MATVEHVLKVSAYKNIDSLVYSIWVACEKRSNRILGQNEEVIYSRYVQTLLFVIGNWSFIKRRKIAELGGRSNSRETSKLIQPVTERVPLTHSTIL